jgi:YidC/Oxa1 family membrane protein insertase
MFLIDWFTIYIYQPFFNLLVGIYWLLQQLPLTYQDMGVAVVIFTIAFRLLLLPISLASDRSEKERRDIEAKAQKIKEQHLGQPATYRTEIKNLFKTNRRIVIAETINLIIQISIALMLWRIFASGLLGGDIHLLYRFMPDITLPFDLHFLGRYDLARPSILFNFILALLIFLVEAVKMFNSPFPVLHKDVIRLQFLLPVVTFLIFLRLPAGKTLFVISTLCFSLVFITITNTRYWLKKHLTQPNTEAASVPENSPDTPQSKPAESS